MNALLESNVRGIRAIPYLARAKIVFCVERNTGAVVSSMYDKMRELEGNRAHLYLAKADDPNALGLWTDENLKAEYLASATRWIDRHNVQYNTDLVCGNPFLEERENMDAAARVAYQRKEFEGQLRQLRLIPKIGEDPFSKPRMTWSGKVNDDNRRNARKTDDMALAFTMAAWMMEAILDGRGTWIPPL